MSLDDYVRALAEVVRRDSRLVSAPLERIHERPSLAGYAPPFAGERFIMDTGRAKQDLGYQPTPLGRWLPDTVNSLLDANEGEDSKDYGRRQAEVEAAEALGLT